MADEEWVLGFGGSDHDFSAALLHGTDVAVAVERERLSRVKYGIPAWYEDPLRMCADYCLAAAGLRAGDVALHAHRRAGDAGVPTRRSGGGAR
jgi:carbamoyltransferase